MGNYKLVVLDFETTGLSPDNGDRAIEIGAVLVSNNQIVDRFQSLMNPGFKISSFIEEYTGITNKMLSTAPRNDAVMKRFYDFIAHHNLVAHNASFDRRFLDTEFNKISKKFEQDLACSMLVSRRVYPDAPNHKLETLVTYRKLKTSGVHHRALADAEMTAHLWVSMIKDIKRRYSIKSVPFSAMHGLAKVPKVAAPAYLKRISSELHRQ